MPKYFPKNILWALVIFLLGFPAPVPAQKAELKTQLEALGIPVKEENGRLIAEATLQQVLKLAQTWNVGLESIKVGEEIAQSVLEASRNRLNPTITTSVEYDKSISALASSYTSLSTPQSLTLTGTNSITLSSELTKSTQSGIEYGLTFTEQRIRALSRTVSPLGSHPTTPASGYDWFSSTALTGSVTVPIGQDFGASLNNIPVRRSELGLNASRLDIRQRELSLLALTAETYWNLMASLENLKVKEEAVRLSQRLLDENRQRLEAGVLSPFDVQVTEAQLAREREQLLVAKSDVLRIEDVVRAILNLEKVDIAMRPLDRPKVRKPSLSQSEMLKRLFEKNTGLRQLQNRLNANNLDLEEARNKGKTDLDFNVYYTFKGYGDSLGTGLEGFVYNGDDSYGASLTWTLPLFDVSTQQKIRQRLLERKRLELDIANIKSELNVRLQSVLRQIRLSTEEVDTARISSNLAKEQLKNEIVRFKVGESTSFQVSQFQQNASEAKVREILAQVKFERNFLALLVLTGELYETYGIEPSHQ